MKKIVEYFNKFIKREESHEVEDLESFYKRQDLRGIINSGNSCYINAALQQVYSNKKLRCSIINAFNEKSFSFISDLAKILMYMEDGTSVKNEDLRFRGFMENFLIHRLKHYGAQGDLSECYANIINQCKEAGIGAEIFDASGLYRNNSFNEDEVARLDDCYLTLLIKNITGTGCKSLNDFINSRVKNQAEFNQDNIAFNLYILNNDGSKCKNQFVLNNIIEVNGCRYILKDVTVHVGVGEMAHYFIYKRGLDGNFYKMSNDTIEKTITANYINENISKNATMATYEKMD